MVTNYQAGAAIERNLKKKFEDKGYLVIRSAGSHGLADLVIITKTHVKLIQVKSYNGAMPSYKKLKEYKDFRELVVPKNVFKYFMFYERGKGVTKIVEVREDRDEKEHSHIF